MLWRTAYINAGFFTICTI